MVAVMTCIVQEMEKGNTLDRAIHNVQTLKTQYSGWTFIEQIDTVTRNKYKVKCLELVEQFK